MICQELEDCGGKDDVILGHLLAVVVGGMLAHSPGHMFHQEKPGIYSNVNHKIRSKKVYLK